MDLSTISMSNLQSAGKTAVSQNSDSNNSDSDSSGWKYLTVEKDGMVYTYIVIGKDIKVLLSEGPAKDDKTKKSANGQKADDANSTQSQGADETTKQNPLTASDTNAQLLKEKLNYLANYQLLNFADKSKKGDAEANNVQATGAYAQREN